MADSLAHTKWLCKYHIVFCPKYRRKIIYSKLRESIKDTIKDLCKWSIINTRNPKIQANPHTTDFVFEVPCEKRKCDMDTSSYRSAARVWRRQSRRENVSLQVPDILALPQRTCRISYYHKRLSQKRAVLFAFSFWH